MKHFSKLLLVVFLIFNKNTKAQQLLAHFPFSNNEQDSSGNNVLSTLNGGANINNSALNIGYNTSDYLSIDPSALDGLDDFIVSLKVKFNTLNETGSYPTNSIFAASSLNFPDRFALSFNKTWNAFVGVVNGVGYYFTPINLPIANEWYCLTITRADSLMSIYVDGELLGTQSCSNATLALTSIIIGQEEDCYQGCFAVNQCLNGSVKDVKFYSGLLDAEKIIASCGVINGNEENTTSLKYLNQVKVYPNPSQDVFFIELSNIKDNTELIITDKLGQIIDKILLNSTITKIAKSPNMLPGIYFLTFNSSNGNLGTKKVIITN
jgi:hypothetical protein